MASVWLIQHEVFDKHHAKIHQIWPEMYLVKIHTISNRLCDIKIIINCIAIYGSIYVIARPYRLWSDTNYYVTHSIPKSLYHGSMGHIKISTSVGSGWFLLYIHCLFSRCIHIHYIQTVFTLSRPCVECNSQPYKICSISRSHACRRGLLHIFLKPFCGITVMAYMFSMVMLSRCAQ